MKFGRLFSIFAQGKTADHTINSPLTLRFRASTDGTPSANQAMLQIYNLSEDIRNDLYKDAFEIQTYKQVVLSAGYQFDSSNPGAINLPIIFQGNIVSAYSYRRGPDWITEITALDGGFAIENGKIDLTVPSPYTFEDVLASVVSGLPKVKLGVIGTFDIDNSRGATFSGNPWDLLVGRISPLNAQVYINKELVNIIQQREYIVQEGVVTEISIENGLLDTPKRQNALIQCRLMFEPRIEMSQLLTVKSLVAGNNGEYKVIRIEHQGTISGAVCEDLITTVTAFGPSAELGAVA